MLGNVLGIAGIAASAFGKNKDKPSAQQSGFAALPQEVKDAYLKTYLPGVLEAFNTPYQPLPMSRVSAPSSVFDSQGLYDLQQYSDSMGGLFGAPQQEAPAQRQSMPATEAETLRGMIAAMNAPTGRGGGLNYNDLSNADFAVMGRLANMEYKPEPGQPVFGNEGSSPFANLTRVLNDEAALQDVFGGIDLSKLSLPINRDYIAGRM